MPRNGPDPVTRRVRPVRRVRWGGRTATSVIMLILATVVGLALAGCSAAPTSRADEAATPRSHTTGHHQQPSAGAATGSAAPRRTYLVVHITDGDTLDLANGETVRLIGMDTPERGECGYDSAARHLSDLVLGKRVTLTKARGEERDRYGRLLRYVDVGRVDAGLSQIRKGYAIARYDSRDGYGRHPREDAYIRADAAHPPQGCAKPQPLVHQSGSGCAPGYSPCVPPYPPDLDCADLDGPIRVTGSDPHGLDADGDGVACEP
ncbi:MAG: thermonuclease family protein [Nocardioidaceae bacterium]